MKFSTDKCKEERNDPDIMYSVVDSELTITIQKRGLRKCQLNFEEWLKKEN